MMDPYRMIFVNIVASCLVLMGTLVYRFIYPKKKINLSILFLIISILPIISIFRVGDYESGDFNIHIYRIMAFYDSLREGNIMPSWAGELNATYGNPLFIFNYSLPYYGVSLLHILGLSFITSMKIYLGASLYLSGMFMYLWIKKLTGNNFAAFTSAIFYIFNPYHLIDVHFRATLGESTIFTLVPLLLYFVTVYVKEKRLIFLVAISLVSELLFLAHPMIAGIFLIISIIFVFSLTSIAKNLKIILFVFCSLAIGVIGSTYSWISFLIYSPYMFSNPAPFVFQDTFSGLFYSPWRYGFLFQGPKGELAYIIGYAQIFAIFIVIFLLFRKNTSKKLRAHFKFWLTVFFLIIFFMSPYSKIIWASFPFFSMLQSNRLLLPVALCTSVLAGYLAISFGNTKKIFIYILLFITIGYTILNWGHRRVIPEIDDNILRKGVWKSTIAEGTTAYFLNNKWADINNFWFSELPKAPLEIIDGKGTVIQMRRTTTMHAYTIEVKTPIVARENTLYFPGWSLKSNNKNVSIYPGTRGVIHAVLPKGKFYLELNYKDIPLYRFFKLLSVILFSISLMLISMSIILDKIKFKYKLRRLSGKPQNFPR